MKNSKLEKIQTENDGIKVEARAIISDLKSQNENVQFANEKLQYALLRFERDPGGIQGP